MILQLYPRGWRLVGCGQFLQLFHRLLAHGRGGLGAEKLILCGDGGSEHADTSGEIVHPGLEAELRERFGVLPVVVGGIAMESHSGDHDAGKTERCEQCGHFVRAQDLTKPTLSVRVEEEGDRDGDTQELKRGHVYLFHGGSMPGGDAVVNRSAAA